MNYTREKLEQLSKEEIIKLYLQDKAKRKRKDMEGNDLFSDMRSKKKRKIDYKKSSDRPMKWDLYSFRHIAIKYLYFGENYHGLAHVEDGIDTVETRLMAALKKCRLVKEDDSFESIKYSRCGRTDKGVNAFSQISAFNVRSSVGEGKGMVSVGTKVQDTELDYVQMLNSNLPNDIRIIGWCPVEVDWDARYQATYRSYLYLFTKGDYDIELMRQGASVYLGHHNFTNFSKKDNKNVPVRVDRTISESEIVEIEDGISPEDPRKLYAFKVTSRGFLWHQVRCMVAMLFSVGTGENTVETISNYLDIEKTPVRPNYNMAADYPLILFDVGYEGLEFIHRAGSYSKMYERLYNDWEVTNIRSNMKWAMLTNLFQNTITADEHAKFLPYGTTVPFPEVRESLKRKKYTNRKH